LQAPILRKGEKVYLRRKNIKIKRPSNKLDYIKKGPYRIKRKLGPVTYELDIPNGTRIHLVFYVALLERAPKDEPYATEQLYNEEEEDFYEVEKILDY